MEHVHVNRFDKTYLEHTQIINKLEKSWYPHSGRVKFVIFILNKIGEIIVLVN